MSASATHGCLYAIGLAAMCLILAAIVPAGVGGLGPHPAPIRSYGAGLVRAAEVVRADSDAAPGGGSIILLHGHRTARTVVLFHGFTNSPRQFRQLAAALHRDGGAGHSPRPQRERSHRESPSHRRARGRLERPRRGGA